MLDLLIYTIGVKTALSCLPVAYNLIEEINKYMEQFLNKVKYTETLIMCHKRQWRKEISVVEELSWKKMWRR